MASSDHPTTFAKCQYCGKGSSPERRIRACTRCFSVGYCSRECQRADWTGGGDGHKSTCRPGPKPLPKPNSLAAAVEASIAAPEEDGAAVARLEKRGDDDGDGNEVWEDAGPINLMEGLSKMGVSATTTTTPSNSRTAPSFPNTPAKSPNTKKELPIATQRMLGPKSSNKFKYRHSSDGADENLLIFFHGAGDSHLPFDALGKRMELPQTATLSLSASISPNNLHESSKNGNNGNNTSESMPSKSSFFVELPFGLGYTWFEEMDYASTGEVLPKEHPRRLKTLKHAVELMDALLCSLTGIHSEGGNNDDYSTTTTWIPERIFLFGFSAGACLVMETCRIWMNAGRMALGGAICISGGIQTKENLPSRISTNAATDNSESSTTMQQKNNQPTDVLIITGSNDVQYSKRDAQLSKECYHASSSKVQVHVQRGKGHAMIDSKEEMQAVMHFLSKRLVRRMVSMEGQCG